MGLCALPHESGGEWQQEDGHVERCVKVHLEGAEIVVETVAPLGEDEFG